MCKVVICKSCMHSDGLLVYPCEPVGGLELATLKCAMNFRSQKLVQGSLKIGFTPKDCPMENGYESSCMM